MRLIDADAFWGQFEYGEKMLEEMARVLPTEVSKAVLEMYKELKERLDASPTIDAVPQWIPCNEMLPDGRLNKSYLVQDKDGRLAVGTYTNWGWMFGHYMNDPVAWMPLPKPYEAERKEE